jgi:hypothetical protein
MELAPSRGDEHPALDRAQSVAGSSAVRFVVMTIAGERPVFIFTRYSDRLLAPNRK